MSEVDVAALRDREMAEVAEMLAPPAELYRKLVATRAEIEGLRERLARQDALLRLGQSYAMVHHTQCGAITTDGVLRPCSCGLNDWQDERRAALDALGETSE